MIILRTVKNISSLNIAASVLLFLAAILAAVVANSSLSPVYQDFLLQELNRETNTIGSKCNDVAIARDVVALKAEVEKIREQVQNIE